MSSRPTVLQAPRARRAGRARTLGIPSLTGAAAGALLLHAVDAWVLQVEGETSLLRRAALLSVVGAGAVAWYGASMLSRRARATLMVVAGVAGLAVIGPVLGSYVDKQGWGGSRFSGAAAFLGSLALTVVGTARLVRAARTRRRRLLALPIALVVAQLFVLPVGSAVLVTNAARPPLGDRSPAELGLAYENVTVPALDGTLLAGWYVPSENGAAVLLRHGSGSTRLNVLDHAAFLAEAGFGTLLLDARGHGASEGRINELGWHGPADVHAALDFLEARPDVTGAVGVLGMSMGGEEALHAAARDRRIAAVVAEGVGVGNYDDSVADGAHALARIVNWTQYAAIEILSDAPQPPGIVEEMQLIAPRPVLLITGDESNEKTMGRLYAGAGGESVTLWELEDTPHTDGLEEHRAEYEARVLDLFEQALLGART